MTKQSRYQKHHKMIKAKERQMGKQQLHFIDANLFLEIILDQPNKDACLSFLSTFRGKQRIAITCTYAIGEVIEKIYFITKGSPGFNPLKSLEALNMIIEKNSIEIYGVNNGTVEDVKTIMDSEQMCGFKDAINIAVANQLGCVCFCTLDYKISEKTLREFGMKKVCTFK